MLPPDEGSLDGPAFRREMDLVIRLTPYPTERLTTALHNRYRIERELGQGGNSERHTCGTGLHHFQEMIS